MVRLDFVISCRWVLNLRALIDKATPQQQTTSENIVFGFKAMQFSFDRLKCIYLFIMPGYNYSYN